MSARVAFRGFGKKGEGGFTTKVTFQEKWLLENNAHTVPREKSLFEKSSFREKWLFEKSDFSGTPSGPRLEKSHFSRKCFFEKIVF